MASTIKIKRSTGSTAPGSLEFGELAYSSGSGKLYFGSSTDGTTIDVFEIGGKAYTDLLSNITAGTASASKAVILDASKDISGLNVVTASSFVGDLTGNADTVTNGVYTTDNGTVTNTMLANSGVTINGASLSLGGTLTLDTDDVAEGAANLYFTKARAQDSFTAGTGVTFGAADVDGRVSIGLDPASLPLSAANTGDGYGSLSYANGVFTFTKVTNADIRGAISVTDAGGDGSLSYDSETGVITYTGPSAAETRAHFSGGTGVTITDGEVAIGQAVGTGDSVSFASVSTTGNVTVGGTLASDDITATTVTVSGDAVITGNLTVQGTTTTVNSTAVAITDINLTLAKDATSSAEANGAGLTVAGADATLTYVHATTSWDFNKKVVSTSGFEGALTGNASTATTWETARDLSLTGDATATLSSVNGSGNVSAALTLATVNSNVGSFGSTTEIPVVTVNAKGLVTAVTTASISTSLTIGDGTATDSVALATDTLVFSGSGAISTAVTDNTVTISVADATTSTKGAASFSDTNFAVTDGAVTIKAGGVDLASNVTGTLPVANGGTGAVSHTAGQLLIGAGTDPVTSDAGLAWDGTTDTLTIGGASISTDNITGAVTISTTATNANMVIAPNGTGSVTIATDSIILDSTGDGVIQSNTGETLSVIGDTGLTLEATSGDITMEVAAGDTAKVTVNGPTQEQYATGLSGNDLVTAYWVENVAVISNVDGGTY